MTSKVHYVADHIYRIDVLYVHYEELALDSKWRIASCLGLLPDLDPSGYLSKEQEAIVDAYIAKFKSTPIGQTAIFQHQQRQANNV